MSRILQFPHGIDSLVPEGSVPAATDEGRYRTSEASPAPDPSRWGLPRAFFVVPPPVERGFDFDSAC